MKEKNMIFLLKNLNYFWVEAPSPQSLKISDIVSSKGLLFAIKLHQGGWSVVGITFDTSSGWLSIRILSTDADDQAN